MSKNTPTAEILKTAPFQKAFENNIDEEISYADSSADLDRQLEKTLNGANRAIFLMKSIVLDKKEYRCQVTTYKNIINMIFF